MCVCVCMHVCVFGGWGNYKTKIPKPLELASFLTYYSISFVTTKNEKKKNRRKKMSACT